MLLINFLPVAGLIETGTMKVICTIKENNAPPIKVEMSCENGILLNFQKLRENVLRQSHLLPGILREHLAAVRGDEGL